MITELMITILVQQAERESENTGHRVRLMHLDRARKGLVQASSRPFGHSVDWFALVPWEVLPAALFVHGSAELGGDGLAGLSSDAVDVVGRGR